MGILVGEQLVEILVVQFQFQVAELSFQDLFAVFRQFFSSFSAVLISTLAFAVTTPESQSSFGVCLLDQDLHLVAARSL